MALFQSICTPQRLPASLPSALRPCLGLRSTSSSSLRPDRGRGRRRGPGPLPRAAASSRGPSGPEPEPRRGPGGDGAGGAAPLPTTKPRRPRRRGRRSEAEAVEDFIRGSLDRAFASIREQDPEAFEGVAEGVMMKEKIEDEDEDDEEEEEEAAEVGKEFVVEEESSSWPLDADVGWGIRASQYFEQHPIKNVVGEDGSEIDWEGEVEDSWVKEINCLEWESFAFHPSPMVVLVFERYNRASDNWKVLKELENAIKVYWGTKDRLPPRAVKVDMNIERDLAYALKVKESPQILFLRGNRILYREKEFRTADELVQMIAHFYYNAKKPSWVDGAALNLPY
ncbi:thioredoxin-like fold domain-containing protein MRL7 homolog, chloroplastic [Syzygium oleosum]|uniref:thioredoxin-like fold domain-containing protein MRL7 homolog, chloroplastic n=1 Tax=Syzygium oleosum TaxID=219896 RepID=UPI0024BA09BC|nr:thioredoxin-like fold domain-containing protein MRL7 homolog, chloroplastic [Syzygium oleosum]XP_056165849.1 thioredoxin-like fold domain-containing protein MRL7 homolog, chloroplastic [Syzygium oleosum]